MPSEIIFRRRLEIEVILGGRAAAALRMSSAAKGRRISKDWINVCWLGVLFLVLVPYSLGNVFLLIEFANLPDTVISRGRIVLSKGMVDFMLLLVWLLAVRFIAMAVFDAVKKDYPLAIRDIVHIMISLVFGYTLDSWSQRSPSISEATQVPLLFLGVHELSNGAAKGWFRENKACIMRGDWDEIFKGIRTFTLSLFITNKSLADFRELAILLGGKFNLALDSSNLLVSLVAFLEICLFVFLVTEIPRRLIFLGCRRCGMLFLKIAVPVSSWDSEHTLRHRHCPKCGAACF